MSIIHIIIGLIIAGMAIVFTAVLPTAIFKAIPEIKEETAVPETGKINLTATTSSPIIVKTSEEIQLKLQIPPKIKKEIVSLPPKIVVSESLQESLTTTTPLIFPKAEEAALPPLDEKPLFSAVVKIQCPSDDGLGKYVGSGFALSPGIIVTAAHVVKDSGSEICEVIFPRERKPTFFLRGVIQDFKEVKIRHDEKGIDVAIIKLPDLDSYPEAKAIFENYPAISYPICSNPQMRGDMLLHFGYPANYVDQNYLSRFEGQAVQHADIKGIRDQLSQDGTYTFKTPIFGLATDESLMHPYMISRVASFYGDSGGLAFNASKHCIIGPHRGGTLGKGPGENFSVFMNLGWEDAGKLLP